MSELRQGWFDVRELALGIHVIEEPLHSEAVKSYLILGTERAALIDTGMGIADIRREVEAITLLPVVVLLSHAHWDHVGDAWRFDDVRIHPAEAADLERGRPPGDRAAALAPEHLSGNLPDGFDRHRFQINGTTPSSMLSDGDVVDLGGRRLVAVHTPGHSPGLMVFIDPDARLMISTDTVYIGEIYLYAPFESALADYAASLTRLRTMTSDVDLLLPSHGPTPIPPTVIDNLSDAIQLIRDGRHPDRVDGIVTLHAIGDFPIMLIDR